MNEKDTKRYVKERYSKIAKKDDSNCECCGTGNILEEAQKQAIAMGYSEEEIKRIPSEAVFGLGCGNPTALAEIKSGETVLDLGSGGGIDVFLASQKVGSEGKVIGVDMTPEMVERSKNNALNGNYENVEFKLGEIEDLPIENKSVDVIISNCVINLTSNKLKAYSEAYRVLKPRGRILVSDLVTEGYIPETIRKSFKAWSECVGGAMEQEEYINTIKQAGFNDVEIVESHFYTEPSMDERLVGKVVSIQVKAIK